MRPLQIALLALGALALRADAQHPKVYRVPVSGTIELGLAPFVARAVKEANAAGAAAVILVIETPGGRVDAAQQMVKAVIGSETPVYALVDAHAWSAGAMIALAADSIFMTPGSSIGAATPVGGTGEKAPEKIVSALRADFRALAERRGLDPQIAAAMVDEDIEIPGVVEQGKLLTLTAEEAVEVGVAAGEVTGLADLLVRLGLGDAEIVAMRINWAEALARFLSNPLVAPLLLSVGMLGIIIEIKTPAFGLAGVTGLAALAAFFGSHLIVGLAGWEEIILLAVGLAALVIEVFVAPGFGVAGIVAILSIGAAIFLALLGSLPTWPDIARAAGIVAVAGGIVTAVLWALLRHLPSGSRFRGIFLQEATSRAAGFLSGSPRDDLVGAEGVAVTDLRPAGVVRVGTERLDVVSDAGFVPQGTRVRIVRAEGYRHVVEPVADTPAQVG